MNTLILLLLLVAVLVTTLVDVKSNETCTERYTIIPGPTPRDGLDGIQGVPGRTGDKGDQGDIGPTGPKGDLGIATITEEDLNHVSDTVSTMINESIITELLDTIQTLNQTLTDRILYLETQVFVTVCNITSANWKRIAYFDTTQGDSCPTGLRTVTNTTTNQTACGRTTGECASVPIPVQSNYSRVCGIVKGYQDSSPDGFGPLVRGDNSTIDMPYVDGVSITQGSPRRHLWTYATGVAEEAPNQRHRCPCARSDPNDTSYIPDFVGDNYYCESGFPENSWDYGVVTWDDPLLDGQDCVNTNNTCCERYGWFHRDVPLSSDDIELRICADQSVTDEDTLIELYEFWVM